MVKPKPGPGRMFVAGRVLDPAGQPVPNATTMVYVRSKRRHSPNQSKLLPVPMGDARCPRIRAVPARLARCGSRRRATTPLCAVAIAPGYGVSWVAPIPAADQPASCILLRPDHIICGRIFDVQGRPVTDAMISVSRVCRGLPPAQAISEGVRYWWTSVFIDVASPASSARMFILAVPWHHRERTGDGAGRPARPGCVVISRISLRLGTGPRTWNGFYYEQDRTRDGHLNFTASIPTSNYRSTFSISGENLVRRPCSQGKTASEGPVTVRLNLAVRPGCALSLLTASRSWTFTSCGSSRWS